MPRTGHTVTTHERKGHPVGERRTPVWGDGADGHALGSGGRAAQEDRDTRSAWPGQRVRSAYLSRVALPRAVAPGDVGEARRVLGRIEAALSEAGRWTKLERRRLQGMREAWERRAGRRDVEFQFVGWVHPEDRGREGERRRWEREEARAMGRVLEAIRV